MAGDPHPPHQDHPCNHGLGVRAGAGGREAPQAQWRVVPCTALARDMQQVERDPWVKDDDQQCTLHDTR